MASLDFPNAVTDETGFFGRREMLSRIQQIFLSKERTPVIVIGERRVGKTSLQNIVVQRLLSTYPNLYHVLYVEPRGINSFSLFANSILGRLGNQAKDQEDQIQFSNSITAIEDFEYNLSLVFRCIQQPVLICIDEFDGIIRQLADQELALLFGAMYFLIEKTSFPLYFFLTMTSIPDKMLEDIPSTLVSTSQVFELEPLTFAEMRHLVTSLTSEELKWSDVGFHELYRLAGGHPYFTKLILYCLINQIVNKNKPSFVTLELLSQAEGCAIQNVGADSVLSNLYYAHFQPEEREILLLLAQRRRPISLNELVDAGGHWISSAKRLMRRHYLQVDHQGGDLDFKIALLGDWLKEWVEFEAECEKYSQLRRILARPEIEVDETTGVVRLNGREIKLSRQEYKIMRCLAAKAEQLVSRDDLIDAAWEAMDGVTDQMIDTALYRLRKKLNDHGQYIETKTGRGFVLHRAVLLSHDKGS